MFDLNITEFDKTFPIMNWLPKMHKAPIVARLIAASKNCGTKPPFDATPNFLKMICNTVEGDYNRSFFHSGCWKFWIVQNSFQIATRLNRITVKKKAKSIPTFDFSTYVEPSHINSS